jgi:hypothetical protein
MPAVVPNENRRTADCGIGSNAVDVKYKRSRLVQKRIVWTVTGYGTVGVAIQI